ncbi:ABC transporter substrate-binding protein [Rubrivivax sp. RP6-9]|uniref:ABC transporter substrate-binding protein n=1 Tax=Rubrivivax sp. RP6-9 TaxID=3415750 RepID=UPI003CC6D65F
MTHASFRLPRPWRAAAVAAAAALCLASPVAAQSFKLGVVTFLSGPAAESFGVPAGNAAKMMVEQFNKGAAPAPYNKTGFGGMKIEMVMVDEAGGAAKQVQEMRNLYQRENVDAIVGYIGSGDCLAVAPAAEELKKLLVLFDCGTPRIFEDASPKYVFRTASHAAMDNISLTRYLKSRNIKADSFNMINQDYAWGQDSKADFVAAMGVLYPNAKPGADLLPKFGAGQYGTEVSALASRPADLTYSSMWGGDLQAFILQADARGALKDTTLVLSAADHVLPGLLNKVPDGTVLGARGAYGILSARSPLNDWFQGAYQQATGVPPVQASYRVTQALMGLKLAVEKAMAANGGKKPSTEQIADALRGSTWDSPGGQIRMALGGGQQAIQGTAIGRTKYDAAAKRVIAVDIQTFPAECTMPPAGVKSLDWIKAGMQGAKC